MAQYVGIIQIKVDGDLLETKEGATLDKGGISRKAMKANGKVIGFKNETNESVLSFEVAAGEAFDSDAFDQTTDATVEVVADNGVSFTITNAFVSEPGKGLSSEGWFKYEMRGAPAQKS